MQSDFVDLAVRRFKGGGFDVYGILSVADQRAFGIAEVGEVEEVGISGGDPISTEPGEIIEPNEVVVDDN